MSEQMVREAIELSASTNTELLVELAATADAPGRLNNLETQLSHTELRVAQLNAELDNIATHANRQLQSHRSYRHSAARRLAYIILRKKNVFDKQAADEEKAYHVVLKKRFEAERQLEQIKANQEAVVDDIQVIKELADRHGKAHKLIDELYASIFNDHTPGHPDEDKQEAKYKVAERQHTEAMERLRAIVRTANTVRPASKKLKNAIIFQELASKESHSTLCSLRLVKTYMSQSTLYIPTRPESSRQSNEQAPWVSDHESLAAEERFYAIIDSAKSISQQDIKSKDQAIQVADSTGSILKQALACHEAYMKEMISSRDGLRAVVRGTARSLEDERQALHQIRQRAFEITVGFGAAAPAYHECCDRAASFEEESNQLCEVS